MNFRLGLPDGWNGKLLFQDVGGLGGTIRGWLHYCLEAYLRLSPSGPGDRRVAAEVQ